MHDEGKRVVTGSKHQLAGGEVEGRIRRVHIHDELLLRCIYQRNGAVERVTAYGNGVRGVDLHGGSFICVSDDEIYLNH